jgi:hypothetical protein
MHLCSLLKSYRHKITHSYIHLCSGVTYIKKGIVTCIYAQKLRTLSNVQLHASMHIAQELPALSNASEHACMLMSYLHKVRHSSILNEVLMWSM